MECKHLHKSGLRVYLLDNYNWVDFTVLSLYSSSYVLRFLVDRWIKDADMHYSGITRAHAALLAKNRTQYFTIHNEIFNDAVFPVQSYFMKACR
jgi:hypothetical protein